ncbi:hypothetical protein FRC07_001971 [Ceratobasidium sp. 392]|nr:hypothetical protein FRC07_001971 [Ceratobasidium sp. 392]
MKSVVILFFAAIASVSVSALAPCPFGPTRPLSQGTAANYIYQCGVGVTSSGGCTDKDKPNCTSLQGIRCGTVNGVCTFKSASGCATIITGGTETGHAGGTYSHANGYKVDIRKSSCVTSYIHKNFKRNGNCPGGYPRYDSSAGNRYCDEGNHWDVTYFGRF